MPPAFVVVFRRQSIDEKLDDIFVFMCVFCDMVFIVYLLVYFCLMGKRLFSLYLDAVDLDLFKYIFP